VAHQLSAEELKKAARNIGKIERYFAARLQWGVGPECVAAFTELKTTADRIAFTVGQKALASGVEARLGAESDVEHVPSEAFDPKQLGKFATFLGRLDRWFVDHASGSLEKGGRRRLAAVQEALESLRMALAEIDLNQKPSPLPADAASSADAADAESAAPAKEADSGPPPSSGPSRPAAPAAAVDDVFEGARRQAEYIEGKTPAQIVFTASGADPMYHWVGSTTVDLTPHGKEELEKLFEEQGITYFRYQFEKFADEIKMRIENAPDGHILVVKVRAVGDERKPFLGYVPEVAL